jgi:hypothetical protein
VAATVSAVTECASVSAASRSGRGPRSGANRVMA